MVFGKMPESVAKRKRIQDSTIIEDLDKTQ